MTKSLVIGQQAADHNSSGNLRLNSWRKGLLPAVLSALLALPAAFAQETTAGVQGSVKDPSSAAIPNATVEVTSPALIGVRKVQTDSSGNYRFSALAPGIYGMTVTASGFRTYRQSGIDLSVGRLPSIDVRLEVGSVAETIEVSDAIPLVDVTRSNAAVIVDQQILNNIPKGRSFQSVIPFAAGARQEPLQGGTSSRDNGFQIDGASDSENVYLVDGVNTTNIANGGVGKSFQMDFIEEVQIKSGGFEAEYGGALGGVINVVPKHGSNEWHGGVFTYFRTNALNANDACGSGYTSGGVGTFAGFSTVCGLRLNPNLPSLSTANRLDGVPEYYLPAKDQRRIVEPGYSIGGPLLKDRLWLFSSYVPTLDSIHRTTTFTGTNPGPRTLTSSFTQHNLYNRLDYRALNSLRLFGAWNYAYSRTQGQLGNPDSAVGQRNTGATTDPNTLRSDFGTVNPNSVYSFGGDWTPTSKLVVGVRYGYFFNNNEQRGTPVGTRYVYQTTVNSSSKDLAGNPFPASSFNTSGFFNIPNNLATSYDAYKRKSISSDASYFVGRFLGGSHTFKGGYYWQSQGNDVLTNFQGGRVDLQFGTPYTPVTSTTACDAVKAQNLTRYGSASCQGLYGYFVVGTGVTNTGGVNQTAKAIYVQDAWNVGHGLTLNLGIRFDAENQPPYDPTRFPSIEFGLGQKIAPRIGGAYDVLHNGKLKIYGSYGKFYDIAKLGLARGSFGSDYWHNCVYAMDDTNYTAITPSYPQGGGCPATGSAPGVGVGRFIENVDFRATKADPRDPAVDPNLKPMHQHEVAFGADWQITPQWGLETRYTRKRLDSTIEDMAITDNLGFYIGNPGSQFADLLHRPVVIPNDAGVNYLTTVPFCAECPGAVAPIRRYDGLEFRLSNRGTGKWFGAMSYTYSRLTGNYAGLTNTDPTDGGGGRHAPSNGRAFDIPTQTYLPSGKIDDGPLSTDRPNTGKVFGYYRQKWMHMETNFGIVQAAFQGTPIGTCLSVVGTSSACQWAEGRGNFVKFSRAANGDIVKDGVVENARSDNYFQTDIDIRHDIPVKERMHLSFELNISNIFNQRAAVAYSETVMGAAAQLISPTRASRFQGDPQVDWGKVMNGYNYMDALNGKGAFAGVQSPITLASRYGLPQVYQLARNMRLQVRFTF
jgi:TonB dependent receptor/Carboxypeptidase regulatory-like domain/TonB-dependent Receptor Plug Domain